EIRDDDVVAEVQFRLVEDPPPAWRVGASRRHVEAIEERAADRRGGERVRRCRPRAGEQLPVDDLGDQVLGHLEQVGVGRAPARGGGRPMVCHVAERTRRARGLARVIVATDDARIAQAIVATGAEAVLTRADHPSGTDRLAEVARSLEAAIVVNVQGDLPLLDPGMVEGLVARMAAEPALPMATLVCALRDEAEWRSPHVVKAVVGAGGRALYF